MSIPPVDRARIEREISAEHKDRSVRWAALAPTLDPESESSRDEWVKARQNFFEEVGVIPGPKPARVRLASMKDRYRGERCFVIGNGPSLNHTALHHLENEFTFGVNRIYLMFERLSWRPTFYTTLDWRVAPDCLAEINGLDGMEFFFPERFRGMLRDGDDVTWYWNDSARHPSERLFANDAGLGIRGAGSVSGAAIQLAYHMGFDPIHVIGCDVSYTVSDTVVQEGPDAFGTGVGLYLTSTRDDDANHFDKRYFGSGKRWHDPNVERMIEGFEQCAAGVARGGRTITNATVGGNLEVFERVDFRSLFPPSAGPPPATSRAAFAVAAVAATGDEPGLMVDVGAGDGSNLAAFAALGWEVRAFEPDAGHRDRLRAAMPTGWQVFLDPRAIDGVAGSRPVVTDNSGGGVSLTPLSSAATSAGTVIATTPQEAMEIIGDRVPDVVAIDANHWEMEILRAWPFDNHRPAWLIIGVDDRMSPRFGFDRTSVCRRLESLGYRVFGFVDDAVVEADELIVPEVGGEVVLVASRVEADIGVAHLRSLNEAAAVTARLIAASTGQAVSAGSAPAPNSDEVAVLRAELDKLRSSTSWRIGRAIVQTLAAIRRAPRALIRRVRR